jgi:4-amino-4-deoxy-L-arabinose transferase-like glycosyltransferase
MATSLKQASNTRASEIISYSLVLITFASLYLITAPGRIWNTDGWTRYLVAEGIVDYGWPLLPPNSLPGSYWIVYGNDGHVYSYYGLGQSLAFVPLYAVGKVISGTVGSVVTDYSLFIASFLNSLVGALLAVAVFGLARQVGYSARVALATATLCGLGTLVWAHSRDNYDLLLETLCLAGTLACLVGALRKNSFWLFGIAGLIYGYGLMTRNSILFAAPGLGLLLLFGTGQPRFEWGRIRNSLIFAAGVLPGLFVSLGYNALRFGSLFATGYEAKAPFWFGTPLWLGLATFLISPGRGLLWFVPLTLAVPFLATRFYRRAPGLGLSVLIIALTYLLIYSQFSGLGLWGWGPYYLLPLMPLIALVWAEAFEKWPSFSVWARWVLGGLVVVSLVIQTLSASTAWIRTYIRATIAHSNFGETMDWQPEWSLLINQPGNMLNAISQMTNGTPLEFMTTPQSYEYQYAHDVGLNTLDWWWVLAAYRGLRVAILIPIGLTAILLTSLWLFWKRESETFISPAPNSATI